MRYPWGYIASPAFGGVPKRYEWAGKHTAFDNIPKGAPKEQWKEIKKELDELIKEGFIVKKPTNYGLHVSLNIAKKAEIEKIIFS